MCACRETARSPGDRCRARYKLVNIPVCGDTPRLSVLWLSQPLWAMDAVGEEVSDYRGKYVNINTSIDVFITISPHHGFPLAQMRPAAAFSVL
ncbi:hypothetical protein EYF80_015616 [Liparis tanakae]|uniref:Uncharacterized protein n=1 Tax=Liparis tanakae TaxID=230148 RepID=A0A4Z2I8U1_9TELE|nr:hypothetical protein EYF80_015616 [Liparis tanakae]